MANAEGFEFKMSSDEDRLNPQSKVNIHEFIV